MNGKADVTSWSGDTAGIHVPFAGMLADVVPTHSVVDRGHGGQQEARGAVGMTASLPATATIGVLTYNILVGGGPRLGAIESVIRDSGADVIGLQEVARPDLLAALADRLGMHHALASSPSGWHVGVLSRWPLVEARGYGGPNMVRGLLEAVVQPPNGERMRVFVTHLVAGFNQPWAGERRRLREVEYVLERMATARASGEPHVLVGDFNSLAPGERLEATGVLRHALAVDAERAAKGHQYEGLPSVDFVLPPVARPFRPLLVAAARGGPLGWLCDSVAGAYVPRAVVRRVRAAGYTDCYAVRHPDRRTRAFTCPLPAPAGRIDYVFASAALAKRLVGCEVLTDTPTRAVSRASDHRPVLATFRLGD
jgi:endonuclease/exonuclease/phosphatase family metal-dependent hydrolase